MRILVLGLLALWISCCKAQSVYGVPICGSALFEIEIDGKSGAILPSWHEPVAPLCSALKMALQNALQPFDAFYIEFDKADSRNRIVREEFFASENSRATEAIDTETLDTLRPILQVLMREEELARSLATMKRGYVIGALSSVLWPTFLYPSSPSMDDLFTEIAEVKGARLRGVETKDVQMSTYESITNDAIRRFAASALAAMGDRACGERTLRAARQKELLEAITAGALDAAYRAYRSNPCYAAFEEEELTVMARNAALTEAVDRSVRRRERPVFAIGALHLMGEGSMLARLERMGYSIRLHRF